MSIYTSAWRKAANEALVHYVDVKLARASYIEAAKRHDWPSYYQIKKAKESMLDPKDICYGDAKVEVSLTAPTAHSTARLLEFFYENDSPVICSLTEDEKMSLELWAKVGGDGQVSNNAREKAINSHVRVHVSVCVRMFNRVKFLVRVRVRVRVRVPGHEPEHRHSLGRFIFCGPGKTTKRYCLIHYVAN